VRVLEPGLEAGVRDDGSFAIVGLAPGAYTLEAGADGYLEQRVSGVAVRPDVVRQVEFRLHPQPFLEEEIVVRPSRVALLRERPDSTFALGREEIESLPHLGDDLFRALSLLPGTAGNDVSAQTSVHGGRRDEVLVLLDGQELYDAYHLKDYDNALSVVSAHALGGASLSTGAYSVSHGDRMSGVLDLQILGRVEPPLGFLGPVGAHHALHHRGPLAAVRAQATAFGQVASAEKTLVLRRLRLVAAQLRPAGGA